MRERVAALRRLRWAVGAVLLLGVAASVAANVLHAQPSGVSRVIAAWSPLALLLAVELISRVPVHRQSLALLRLAATTAIAGIAAWVSYWHMVGVAVRYGETAAGAAYVLPLSVDGLVVVASISLVEIAGRIRSAPHSRTAGGTPRRGSPPLTADPVLRLDQEASDRRSSTGPLSVDKADRRDPFVDPERSVQGPGESVVPSPPADSTDGTGTLRSPASAALPGPSAARARSDGRAPSPPGNPRRAMGQAAPGGGRRPTEHMDDSAAPATGTAAAVASWYRRDPAMHPAEIAKKIGRSERTVRRYWPPPEQPPPPHRDQRLAPAGAGSPGADG